MSLLEEDDPSATTTKSRDLSKEASDVQVGTEPGGISWVRVSVTASVALLVIVPTLFYLASSSEVLDGWITKGNPLGLEFGGRSIPAFDLATASVPREEIHHGGPPKDGIPALSEPSTIPATEAQYLDDGDRVIGVSRSGQARAYPLKILNHHEIVNDVVGEMPIAVTYCPLCDSAAVFDRQTELGLREFGVSGLLYNSNVLMYDRADGVESLWSQVQAQGVTGPGTGVQLIAVPSELTTWSDWKTRFPETTVLSTETGHDRNYTRSPYRGYFEIGDVVFPVKPFSNRLPTKERVLGVWSGNAYWAFPESSFSDEHNRTETILDGKQLVIEFDSESKSLRVSAAEEGIQWMHSFWFAWFAMHPETELYQPTQ